MAFSLACRMMNDKEVAKDVLQDALIKAWNNFKQFDRQRKFSTWFYSIVMNTCRDYLKAPVRKMVAVDMAYTMKAIGEVDLLESKELRSIILTLKDKLPQRQRDVFVLHDLQGQSLQEVEEILGINSGTGRSHLYYARKSLRAYIQKYNKNEKDNEQKVHK